jgi:UDP-perosamine 4-acetyltransferase
VSGVISPDYQEKPEAFGVRVLGGDESIRQFSPLHVQLVNGIGALPGFTKRWQLCANFRNRGYRFFTVVHPSAVIALDTVLEEGAQVMAGVVIQPGVTIGRDTIINTRASIDHDCTIGPNSHIAPGAVLSGGITIGAGCHIGTGASVIQGVSIGEGAVVSAGAIVYEDVPSGKELIQKRNNVFREITR